MIRDFIVGAIAGGILVWKWRDAARGYAQAKTRPVRIKVAGSLRTLQQKAEGLADTAKERISTTLESTREAILPPGQEETSSPSGVTRAN
jgi:hypothetical protein